MKLFLVFFDTYCKLSSNMTKMAIDNRLLIRRSTFVCLGTFLLKRKDFPFEKETLFWYALLLGVSVCLLVFVGNLLYVDFALYSESSPLTIFPKQFGRRNDSDSLTVHTNRRDHPG